jgi:hypothetical protein
VIDPARPVLVAEYQLVVTLESGNVFRFPCESAYDAQERARGVSVHSEHAICHVERRLVSPWLAVSQPMAVKVDPGVGTRGRAEY